MSAARRRRASSGRTLKTTATALLALSPVTTTGFVAPMPTNVRPNTPNSAFSTLARSIRPLITAGDGGSTSGNYRASSIIMLEGSEFGRLLLAARKASAGRAVAGSADIGARVECGSPNGSRRDRRASTATLKAVSNGNNGGYGGDNKRRIQQRRPSNGYNSDYAYGSSDSRPPGSGPLAGQGRGGGERSWRTAGDIPGLVLGVGILVARHRRELRADQERRQTVSHTRVITGKDEEEETSSVFGAGLAGAGAGLRSRRAASGRRSREGERADGDLELSRRWDEGESEREEEGEEAEWVEGEDEEVAAEQEQLPYQRADTTRRSSASERHVSSALEVSLDRSVMPDPVSPFLAWGGAVTACLFAVAVLARLPRMLGAVGSLLGSTMSRTVEPAYKHSQLPAVVGDLRYSARLRAGSLRAWAARRADAWERVFGPEEVRLPADDWSVCTLVERNRVGGSVLRYRFRLEGSPDAVLPLELGQELTLCGLDTSNRVVHGNYVPLSPRKQRGYFDIVVKRDTGDSFDDGLGSTRSDMEFSRYLDKLPIGDEIAVKPGREGLVYSGPYSPITDVVLIATGLGVVPMIQMVNELLPSRDSSVSTASVIWLNEKAEDFALYGELEKAFFRNHRKLDVSCIVERDLFGHQLGSNPNVREATPEFKIGTLAAVAGPEFFNRKVIDYLVHEGYPEEAIVKL